MSHVLPPGHGSAHADGDDAGGDHDDQQRQRGHRDVEGVLEHGVDDLAVAQVERREGGAVARGVGDGVHVGDDVILEARQPAAAQAHDEDQGHQDGGVSATSTGTR